jgi:hypothetical protein
VRMEESIIWNWSSDGLSSVLDADEGDRWVMVRGGGAGGAFVAASSP